MLFLRTDLPQLGAHTLHPDSRAGDGMGQLGCLVFSGIFLSADGAALARITRVNLNDGGLVLFCFVGQLLFEVIKRPRNRYVAIFGSDPFCGVANA